MKIAVCSQSNNFDAMVDPRFGRAAFFAVYDDTADELSVFFLQNFPVFFKIIDQGLQTDKELSLAHRQEDLEAFIEDRKDQLPAVWQTVRTIGARIWDGVRRVWGWFKRMLTVFKKKILKIGTNLSRLIYDFALESFTVATPLP